MPLFAIKDRIDVSAACQQQSIDLGKHRSGTLADLEHTRDRTGFLDGGDVVVQPAAPRHANDWGTLVHDHLSPQRQRR